MANALREISNVRQIGGERRRRWFTSDALDLVVWYDDNDFPIELQFCYDKGRNERALTWCPNVGYTHFAVDDGEHGGGMRYKSTPIMVADGKFDQHHVMEIFREGSMNLPAEICNFVAEKLQKYSPTYSKR